MITDCHCLRATEAEPALAREDIGRDCPSLPPEIITKALLRATEASCNTQKIIIAGVDFKILSCTNNLYCEYFTPHITFTHERRINSDLYI